jgi:hypothetical protein
MERYSKLQLNRLMQVKKENEARLARTTSIALTNEWRQKQNMRNYQSEYDRIRNELSNSALPFKTQENIKKRKVELEKLGATIYNIMS